MFEFLWQIDQSVLRFMNLTLAHPAADAFWRAITHLHRQPVFLIAGLPLLLAPLIYIYRMQALKPLLALGLAVGLADSVCYRGIKALTDRPRPFQNQEVAQWVRKAGDAHGSSFPSNHAANCFAGATVLAFYFRRQRYFFYTFALLVALSRPALGVHYPSDVVAGAILGVGVASLVRIFVLERVDWFQLHTPVS